MASTSKRAQARTEKELHDLLRVSGNSTCADCGARNPSWASWNLGIFLCMRCASIHRKLGTHISKIKSLSMDTWSNDQVDMMKKNGNLAVNKVYNPKNKRPDMPLDADEVDGAMERFIRKKYQEKSLSDGRPEVPSRDEALPPRPRSPEEAPPPIVPSKKSKFFGFGLRASSSAYPLSKHDKKKRNEPRVDSAFRITSEDYTSRNTAGDSRAEISDHDLQVKLGQLRDMGFTDTERNINVLKRQNGDLERAIASLVKLGPSEQPQPRRTTPTPTVSTRNSEFPTAPTQTSVSAPQPATVSNNPYNQFSQPAGFGLSFGEASAPAITVNTNPWQTATSSQPRTGLEQSFSNMQVSQPLFPNSTGGHPAQPQYLPQQAPPAMPSIPQQYAITNSPVSTNNPFMQGPLSAHSTGNNPYASHMQSMPNFAPSTNPFMSMQGATANQQPSLPAQGANPFGLPPSSSPPQARTQPLVQQPQSGYYNVQSTYAQPGYQSATYGETQYPAQQQLAQSNGLQSPPLFPEFQYGQPPQPQQAQSQMQSFQQQQPQSPPAPQSQFNPFFQQQQTQQFQPQPQQQQFQPQQQNPQFQQPPSPGPQNTINPYMQQQFQQQQQPQAQAQLQLQQAQPLSPQMTGQLDKRSILALYNHPQLAPTRPLAPIPEPTENPNQFQQQQISAAPSATVNAGNGFNPGKRSATMPVSSMHSAGGTGSRNLFMNITDTTNNNNNAQGFRHASHDSVAVNNPILQAGRHSPDAFANLSSRYMK